MAQPTGGSRHENKGGITPGHTGTHLGQTAKEAASTVGEKAREGATGVMDKAREAASSAASTAGGVASNIGQKAEDATSSVGSGMKNLAGTVREYGPQGGFMGSATSAVADTLESGGEYLQDSGLSGIGDDLTNLIRRNPIPALLVGIGIGFLLAQATMNRR